MDGNKRNLSTFAKKRNSHGYFKYIKKHKIIPRNCCFGVITLYSPKNVLFIFCPSSTVIVLEESIPKISVSKLVQNDFFCQYSSNKDLQILKVLF